MCREGVVSDALLHHLQVAPGQVLELAPDVLSEVPRRVDHATRGPDLYYARHLAHVTSVASDTVAEAGLAATYGTSTAASDCRVGSDD